MLVIEASPGFSRWDIVDRVLKASKYTNIPVYILIDTLSTRKMIWVERGKRRENPVYDIINAARTLLSHCTHTVMLNEESAETLSPPDLYGEPCIVMGLHTDIPAPIPVLLGVYSGKRLGDAPYLASQCIYIIGYLYRQALGI